MILGEALKVAISAIALELEFSRDPRTSRLIEAYGAIKFAIDNNLEELIEQAVSELSKTPKEGVQDLAIALTQIVEGGKE